jgi:3-oxoacyl-[acyl-carrier-protein] synthase II
MTADSIAETSSRKERARVVITGMGVISPLGLSPETFRQNLLAGKSGVGPVTLFDASDYRMHIAAQVNDLRSFR